MNYVRVRSHRLDARTLWTEVANGSEKATGVFMQPVHSGGNAHKAGNHWVLVVVKYNDTGANDIPQVAVLDSMFKTELQGATELDIRRAVIPCGPLPDRGSSDSDPEPEIGEVTVTLPYCAQQQSGSACGLFVVANMFLIAEGLMEPFAAPDSDNSAQTFRFEDAQLYAW